VLYFQIYIFNFFQFEISLQGKSNIVKKRAIMRRLFSHILSWDLLLFSIRHNLANGIYRKESYLQKNIHDKFIILYFQHPKIGHLFLPFTGAQPHHLTFAFFVKASRSLRLSLISEKTPPFNFCVFSYLSYIIGSVRI
jgi:hypothetical protein